MTGQLYINDKDAWCTWGVYLADGSYQKLLLPPPMKAYTENNFRSHPVKQVFIVNPQPDERDVQIEFCLKANCRADYLRKYEDFVREISFGFVKFQVTEINKGYMFLYQSAVSLSYFKRLGRLLVRFNEPEPGYNIKK
jgi:hypothetical protein